MSRVVLMLVSLAVHSAAGSRDGVLETDHSGFQECNESVINPLLPKDHQSYKSNGYTNRGWVHVESIVPPFLDLPSLLRGCSVVWEYGCGSSRFLLEAKFRFPAVNFIGSNYKLYGLGQADDQQSTLLTIASHFSIPLMCSEVDNTPALPAVVLTESIGDRATFRPPGNGTILFDLILSRDALNQGKVIPSDSHIFIPMFIETLKPGAMAILQIAYAASFIATDLNLNSSAFVPLAVRNLRFRGEPVSLFIYKMDNSGYIKGDPRFAESTTVNVVLRRCPTGVTGALAASESVLGDCILPKNVSESVDPTLWDSFISAMANFNYEVKKKDIQYPTERRLWLYDGISKYTKNYLLNFAQKLKAWEEASGLIEEYYV